MARPASAAGPDVKTIMANLSASVKKGNATTVTRSALLAKRVHEQSIARVAGADMSLSGVNRAKGRNGGVKVGVNFKITTKGSVSEGLLKATGPLQLVENDTSGHVIRSAFSKGARRKGFIGPVASGQFSGGGRGGKGVLRMPDGGFRRSVRHPGTKGQHPWQKGADAAKPVIRKAMTSQTRNIIKGAAGL